MKYIVKTQKNGFVSIYCVDCASHKNFQLSTGENFSLAMQNLPKWHLRNFLLNDFSKISVNYENGVKIEKFSNKKYPYI